MSVSLDTYYELSVEELYINSIERAEYEEKLSQIDANNKQVYVSTSKDNKKLLVPIEATLATLSDPYYLEYFIPAVLQYNSEDSYVNIKEKAAHDDRLIEDFIGLFNPNPYETIDEIISNQSMIRSINDLVSSSDGEIAKLLLTTLFNMHNIRQIFTRASGIGEIPDSALANLESNEHTSNVNLNVDALVGIREIITSIFIDLHDSDSEKLSEKNKNIFFIIRTIKDTLFDFLSTSRRKYWLKPILSSTCTGVRSRWLCDTLKFTNINCKNITEFTSDQFTAAKEFIMDCINNIDVSPIDKDNNYVIIKPSDESSQYMIGGKYQNKYLKYKAKYLKLKNKK